MKLERKLFSKFLYFILLLLWVSYLPICAQNSAGTDQLAEQLQSLTKKTVADVVYLQTSKGIYETEEDVWFKVYVLDGQYFTPSARSKNLISPTD